MAHQVEVTEEQYVFKPETRKKLFILLIVGAVLFALGLVLAMSGPAHHEETKGGHAALQNNELVASVQQHAAASEGHGAAWSIMKQLRLDEKTLFFAVDEQRFLCRHGNYRFVLRCNSICCSGRMVGGCKAYRHCDGHLDSDRRNTDAYSLVCNQS